MIDDFAWAACSMSDWMRPTISSGSAVSPSRIMVFAQSCKAHWRTNGSLSALAARVESRRTSGASGLTLEDALRGREVAVVLLEEALHLEAEAAVGRDEAARAVGQPLRGADGLDPRPEGVAEEVEEPAESPFGLLGIGVGLVGLAGELEVGGVDRGQGPAVVGVERGDDELVDRVGQQQHLDAPLPEDLEVRALADRGEVGPAQVVDDLLLGRGPLDVVVEAGGLVRVVDQDDVNRRRLGHAVAVAGVDGDPSFRVVPNWR